MSSNLASLPIRAEFLCTGIIPLSVTTKRPDDICGICREDFDVESSASLRRAVLLQDCGHIFHAQCICTWLSPPTGSKPANTCPACRRVLFQRPDREAEIEQPINSTEPSEALRLEPHPVRYIIYQTHLIYTVIRWQVDQFNPARVGRYPGLYPEDLQNEFEAYFRRHFPPPLSTNLREPSLGAFVELSKYYGYRHLGDMCFLISWTSRRIQAEHPTRCRDTTCRELARGVFYMRFLAETELLRIITLARHGRALTREGLATFFSDFKNAYPILRREDDLDDWMRAHMQTATSRAQARIQEMRQIYLQSPYVTVMRMRQQGLFDPGFRISFQIMSNPFALTSFPALSQEYRLPLVNGNSLRGPLIDLTPDPTPSDDQERGRIAEYNAESWLRNHLYTSTPLGATDEDGDNEYPWTEVEDDSDESDDDEC